MNTSFLKKRKAWLLAVLFLFVGVMDASAEIRLTDSLSVTGFVRQMFAVHTAQTNPNNKAAPPFGAGQEDNNRINLSRTQIQTELTFKPNDTFKLFANMRFIYDQTDLLDSDLKSYDAFPLSTPHYGTTLRVGHDEEVMADIWELYADLNLGPLWLRIGKQQIVWGEMFGWRIMDCINPLDLSWHFRLPLLNVGRQGRRRLPRGYRGTGPRTCCPGRGAQPGHLGGPPRCPCRARPPRGLRSSSGGWP